MWWKVWQYHSTFHILFMFKSFNCRSKCMHENTHLHVYTYAHMHWCTCVHYVHLVAFSVPSDFIYSLNISHRKRATKQKKNKELLQDDMYSDMYQSYNAPLRENHALPQRSIMYLNPSADDEVIMAAPSVRSSRYDTSHLFLNFSSMKGYTIDDGQEQCDIQWQIYLHNK